MGLTSWGTGETPILEKLICTPPEKGEGLKVAPGQWIETAMETVFLPTPWGCCEQSTQLLTQAALGGNDASLCLAGKLLPPSAK